MLHTLIDSAARVVEITPAKAHCDIPCRIYDPGTAIIAALSVIRIMDIMAEAAGEDDTLERTNTIARCVMRKEEEAERVKHEVRIIWGDYFKAPQFEAHPEVHELAHRIMLRGSACKQTADRANGEDLLELVNQFAEAFWDSKGVKTARREAPYPPSLPVVHPEP